MMVSKLTAALPRAGAISRWGVMSGLAVAAAGLLAACASAGGSSGTAGTPGASGGSPGAAHQAAAHSNTVVSARKVAGVGTVLADSSGKTLYTAQQEGHGKIVCTGGCLAFWFPVKVASGASLHAPDGATGVLGTIHRPDNGVTQLTYNGKPLYTFRLDQAPGDARGNNFSDQFGGVSFTWRVATASGAPAGTTGGTGQQGNSGGYSY
jgi:predicted lipoprotein with Yx(FWY)xxD motif